jgi:hypothetical protein
MAPLRRTELATRRPPNPLLLALFLPLALLLMRPAACRAVERVVLGGAALWLTVVVIFSGSDVFFYQAGWSAAWSLLFLVAAAGAWLVWQPDPAGASEARSLAVVLACMAVSLALVEFPYAHPIYVLYAFPLTLLAAVSVLRVTNPAKTLMLPMFVTFLFLFGLFRLIPSPLNPGGKKGIYFDRGEVTALLDLPRSRLRVPASQAIGYRDLVELLRERAEGPIWAGPDAPEVYFLSGIPNRTRTMFEFLRLRPASGRGFVDELESRGVSMVVVNLVPGFSEPIAPASIDSLRVAFPGERQIMDYLVLWK